MPESNGRVRQHPGGQKLCFVCFMKISCAKFRKSSPFFGVREKIVSDFLTERRTEAENKKEGERERETLANGGGVVA